MSEDRRRSVGLGRPRSASVDLGRPRSISRDLPRAPVDLIRIKFGPNSVPVATLRGNTAGPSPGHRRYLRRSRDRHVTRTMGYSAAFHSPSLATESGVDAHRCAVRIQNAASGPICRPRPRESSGTTDDKKGRPHLTRGSYERAHVPRVQRTNPPGVPPTISHGPSRTNM